MQNVSNVRLILLNNAKEGSRSEGVFDELVSFQNTPTAKMLWDKIFRRYGVIHSAGYKQIVAVYAALRYAFPGNNKTLVEVTRIIFERSRHSPGSDQIRKSWVFDIGALTGLLYAGAPLFDTVTHDDEEYDQCFVPFFIEMLVGKHAVGDNSGYTRWQDEKIEGEIANAIGAYAGKGGIVPGRQKSVLKILKALAKRRDLLQEQPVKMIATDLVHKRFNRMGLEEQIAAVS